MTKIELRKYQALEHLASKFVIKAGAVVLVIIVVAGLIFVWR